MKANELFDTNRHTRLVHDIFNLTDGLVGKNRLINKESKSSPSIFDYLSALAVFMNTICTDVYSVVQKRKYERES